MSFNFNLRSFIRAFYLPTVCCVCGQTAAQVALKACAGCKLITYCSPSHQKEHWTDHKSFCQAARAVSKVMKVSCLFQNSYESVTLFKLYRDVILLALVKQLGRPLEMFEQEMIYYPNCCMVCHRYEKYMITCNTCSYVWYCSEEHKTSDSKAHSKLCKHLSNLVKFHLGYIVMREKNICKGYCVTNLDDKFPKNLESFMNVSVNLMEVSTYLGEELCEIHASDCFSFPMTAVYALKKCCKTLGRNLVIHVVGAQDMEPNDLNLWKCLRIILEDNFDKVTIVLVGPELNMEFFSRSVSANTGDKFEYKASKNYYHTFYEEENIEYQPPDLIIAFNCGFHAGKSSGEPDSWKDTIPYFCKHPNALIVFTSYSKKEAEDDLEYFIANCGGKELEMLVKHERNPFRSLKPGYVLWESREDALFFANDHITILKSK